MLSHYESKKKKTFLNMYESVHLNYCMKNENIAVTKKRQYIRAIIFRCKAINS